MRDVQNPLIVALDVPSRQDALRLVELLADQVGLFKVGLQLFSAEGPALVREILSLGGSVFLDLKLHDIPNTVAQAAVEAGRMGVQMITLHTLGGPAMLEKTREVVDTFSEREGWEPPRLLGVTILTSMTEESLRSIGIHPGVSEAVERLAGLAVAARLDGVVASPKELPLLSQQSFGSLLRVIPGIRPKGAAKDDQARITTPGQAIGLGADYLVIGRPITQAEDPSKAAREVSSEISRARIEGA